MNKTCAMIAALVIAATTLLTDNAKAQIKMEIIGPGSTLSAIAVSDLKNLGAAGREPVSAAFTSTLVRNLELSGYFRIVDPAAYIEDPQQSGYELGQFKFANWSAINTVFLVKGAIRQEGASLSLTAFLYDVAQQRRMMGKQYSGGAGDVGRMARRFADAILEASTGVRGPFDSKLAFISTRGGRFKEIYTQSIDGQELFRLTDNKTINLFPSWDRNGNELLYLSYKSGEPTMYLANLNRRIETQLPSQRGRVIGGAISPNGDRIAAAVEHSGYTNLYLFDRDGHELRALTETRSINVGPSFSPDGRAVAFTSDRAGTPQIWMMSLEGGDAKRLTYSGNYNTTPKFAPKGDRIAYQSREGGGFEIYSIAIGGGPAVRMTDGIGSNQSPTWSPDGRYIAFSSNRAGRPRVYLLQVATGKIISALTEGKGDDTSPAWSWWLGE
ncbi:MAG: DPP IV N-terminal domain-containing protein [Candidatus Binataceae bacterium]